MLTADQAHEIIGATVYSEDNEKVGKIGQLFLDEESGSPEWVTVSTGFFGAKESFIPLVEARVEGDRVLVPYRKDQVKDAPNIDVDGGRLSANEEADLYRYYGLSYTEDTAAGYSTDTEGYDTSGPSTDDAMTRSEERLRVGPA